MSSAFPWQGTLIFLVGGTPTPRLRTPQTSVFGWVLTKLTKSGLSHLLVGLWLVRVDGGVVVGWSEAAERSSHNPPDVGPTSFCWRPPYLC